MPEEIKEDEAPREELNEEEASAGKEEKPAETRKKFRSKKWIFIIILGLLLGTAGLGIKFAPDRLPFLANKKFNDIEVNIDEDNLSEETLSPFFIPPGPGNDTIRIDLSVVWDALASIRFRKKELGIRKLMYDKFYDMAEQNQDLNEKIPLLENEVSSMLRSKLGVQNLVVKIKEIRYF